MYVRKLVPPVMVIVAITLLLCGASAPAFATYQLTLESYLPPPYYMWSSNMMIARATDGAGLPNHNIIFERPHVYSAGAMLGSPKATDANGYAISTWMNGPYVGMVTFTAQDTSQAGSPTATCDLCFYGTDLQTDSNNDGTISIPYTNYLDTADEDVEMTAPGRVVALNSDDDDGNSTVDSSDIPVPPATTVTVDHEDDLVPVNLIYSAPDNYTITLMYSANASATKIWSAKTKGTLILGNQNGNTKVYVVGTDTIPSTVWVEGVSPGQTVLDVIFKDAGGVERPIREQVKFTVASVRLAHVTFDSTSGSYFKVAKDSDGSDYDASGINQWEDTDYNGVADHEYPLCFARNTKMKVTATFKVTPTTMMGATVKIKGNGPDGLSFPPTTATKSGDYYTVTNLECASNFMNEVHDYEQVPIDWYISPNGGTSWVRGATSQNEIFLTLGTPGCATNFRTALHLATQNGGNDGSSCLTNTWASFSGRTVKMWDQWKKGYTRLLCYYYTFSGGYRISAAALLASGVRDAPNNTTPGDGQCGAWADLLNECFKVNGSTDTSITEVLPCAGYDQFGVAKITFDDIDPAFPLQSIWKYGDDDIGISAADLPGQNMNPPSAKLFNLHYIVNCAGNFTYYDPSYGLTTTGPSDYTPRAIEAWRDSADFTPAHWEKASDETGALLTF